MYNYDEIHSANRKRLQYSSMKKRKQQLLMYKDVYNGNHQHYTARLISNTYDNLQSNKKNLLLKRMWFTNVTKSIMDKISILFQSGLQIQITDNQQSTKLLNDKLQKKYNLQNMLTTLNIYTNLLYDMHIYVKYNEQDNDIQLLLLTPDKVYVVQDDYNPKKAKAIFYLIQGKSDTINGLKIDNIFYITKQYMTYAYIKQNGQIVQTGQQMPNPFNQLPFAHFTDEYRIDTYFSNKSQLIVPNNITLNVKWTQLFAGFSYQAFSTLVLSNVDDEDTEVGIDAIIAFKRDYSQNAQPGTAQYINPGINFTQLKELLQSMQLAIALQYGVNADLYKSTNNATSGYQLKLSRQDLLNSNIEDIPLYQQSLTKTIQLIMKAQNIYLSRQSYIWTQQDIANVKVTINKPKFENNQAQQISLLRDKVSMNITSAIDYLMQKYSLSQQQATKRYNKYYQLNNKMHQSLMQKTNIEQSMLLDEQQQTIDQQMIE